MAVYILYSDPKTLVRTSQVMLQQTLEVCDRYDTGYNNDRVAIVGFDKHRTSDEKLVQSVA